MMKDAKLLMNKNVDGALIEFFDDGYMTISEDYTPGRDVPRMVVEDVNIDEFRGAIQEFENEENARLKKKVADLTRIVNDMQDAHELV